MVDYGSNREWMGIGDGGRWGTAEMKFDCKKWYARCSGSTEREERVVEGK
jgi:hypothetical protein